MRVGRGRLVVFGDAGILVTPEEPVDFEPPWNVWQKQNPQLFLNALRWLSSQLNKEL